MQDLRLGLKRSNHFPIYFSFNSMPNASGVDVHLFMGSSVEETPSLGCEKILSLLLLTILPEETQREGRINTRMGEVTFNETHDSSWQKLSAEMKFDGFQEVLFNFLDSQTSSRGQTKADVTFLVMLLYSLSPALGHYCWLRKKERQWTSETVLIGHIVYLLEGKTLTST